MVTPIDTPDNWWLRTFEERPVTEALARRDFGVVFRVLRSSAWSVAALARATGLGEFRIREVVQGRRVITTFDVIARIALETLPSS